MLTKLTVRNFKQFEDVSVFTQPSAKGYHGSD